MRTDDCRSTREWLGWGEPLPAAGQLHSSNCLSCQELGAEYALLDDLFGAEPAPAAPLDLADGVMGRIVAHRRAETVRVRLQAALVLAAVALLVLLGSILDAPLLDGLREQGSLLAGEAEHTLTLWTMVEELLFQTRRAASAAFQATLTSAPSPSLVLLLVLAPALLLLNWSICRRPSTPAGAA